MLRFSNITISIFFGPRMSLSQWKWEYLCYIMLSDIFHNYVDAGPYQTSKDIFLVHLHSFLFYCNLFSVQQNVNWQKFSVNRSFFLENVLREDIRFSSGVFWILKLWGAFDASQQTFFIVSGSHSSQYSGRWPKHARDWMLGPQKYLWSKKRQHPTIGKTQHCRTESYFGILSSIAMSNAKLSYAWLPLKRE